MARKYSPPPESTGHLCQDGCGQLAQHIVIDLEDSSVNMLATTCFLGMMTAVIAAAPGALEAADASAEAAAVLS